MRKRVSNEVKLVREVKKLLKVKLFNDEEWEKQKEKVDRIMKEMKSKELTEAEREFITYIGTIIQNAELYKATTEGTIKALKTVTGKEVTINGKEILIER